LLTPESITFLKLIALGFAAIVNQVIFLIQILGMLTGFFGQLAGAATSFVDAAVAAFKTAVNWLQRIWDSANEVGGAFDQARSAARWFIDGVVSGFRNISRWVSNVAAAIRRIRFPSPPAWLRSLGSRLFAEGGIVTGPTQAVIGEAGAEAVIPLTRPLAQVDQSVRGMAALIRGSDGAASPTTVNAGRQMTNNWTINTPNPDGRVVASQVINRLATETV
jgi:hypothetical protein